MRLPLEWLLALLRALKPLHLAHGYGIFTPLALRNFSTTRLVLRVYVCIEDERQPSNGTGESAQPQEPSTRPQDERDQTPHSALVPIDTLYNSSAAGGRLQFFAPHMPRIDHHFFYEGVELDLLQTTALNPCAMPAP